MGILRSLLRPFSQSLDTAPSPKALVRMCAGAGIGGLVWWVSRDGGRLTLRLSPLARSVLGLGLHDPAPARNLLRRARPEDRPGLLDLLRRSAQGQPDLSADIGLRGHDGRCCMVHLRARRDHQAPEGVIRYEGLVQDLTDRWQTQDHYRQLAHRDSLTGLPNRRQMLWRTEQALEAARREGHRMALLLVDLDGFKRVNDRMGHSTGDALLVEVGQRLRYCVRHADEVQEGLSWGRRARSHRDHEGVGRWGGDEFVALLPEVGSRADADRVSRRMREVLCKPMRLEGQVCGITASIGLSLFPDAGGSVADLLRHADHALRGAKAIQPSRCHFTRTRDSPSA
ncbi:MAG: diguanylate cyclase domain-containing protein [Burkholderiaceae bacterium]